MVLRDRLLTEVSVRHTKFRLLAETAAVLYALFSSGPVFAQTGPTTGSWQTFFYLNNSEFQDSQPNGSITPQYVRDLMKSIGQTYQVYPDTPPQYPMIGNAQGAPVEAILQLPCPVGGILLNPTINVNTTITNGPANTTYCFTPGIYRTASVTPPVGTTMIGMPGAVFNGAALLTTWAGSGPYTIASPQGSGLTEPNGTGVCN